MAEELHIEVRNYLAHRYPFLLVDRVLSLGEDNITTLKNVTENEPFFQGHFPGRPVMPGVLMLEGMAQSAAIMGYHHLGYEPQESKSLFYLTGVDNARFKRMVVPGDQLIYELKLVRSRGKAFLKVYGEARVDGELACCSDLTAMHVNDES